jgi:hypothetical protein
MVMMMVQTAIAISHIIITLKNYIIIRQTFYAGEEQNKLGKMVLWRVIALIKN